MRLREGSDPTPKPLVRIGNRPILWHIMRYYAHYGHNDFILCLGWQAETIREYFRTFKNRTKIDTNAISASRRTADDLQIDVDDWNITFVETGIDASIGQRLRAVEPLLRDENAFLANYADGLSDLYLPDLIDYFHHTQSIGAFLSVRPHNNSFHAVESGPTGRVTSIRPIIDRDIWMNGGFFVFAPNIFDYIEQNDELVEKPFERLIAEDQLRTLKYDGFWACMDTFKEKQILEDFASQGPAPWEVWRQPNRVKAASPNNKNRSSKRVRRGRFAVPGAKVS